MVELKGHWCSWSQTIFESCLWASLLTVFWAGSILRVVLNFPQGIWSEQNTQDSRSQSFDPRRWPKGSKLWEQEWILKCARVKIATCACHFPCGLKFSCLFVLDAGQTILVASERRRICISGRDSSAFTSSISEKKCGDHC